MSPRRAAARSRSRSRTWSSHPSWASLLSASSTRQPSTSRSTRPMPSSVTCGSHRSPAERTISRRIVSCPASARPSTSGRRRCARSGALAEHLLEFELIQQPEMDRVVDGCERPPRPLTAQRLRESIDQAHGALVSVPRFQQGVPMQHGAAATRAEGNGSSFGMPHPRHGAIDVHVRAGIVGEHPVVRERRSARESTPDTNRAQNLGGRARQRIVIPTNPDERAEPYRLGQRPRRGARPQQLPARRDAPAERLECRDPVHARDTAAAAGAPMNPLSVLCTTLGCAQLLLHGCGRAEPLRTGAEQELRKGSGECPGEAGYPRRMHDAGTIRGSEHGAGTPEREHAEREHRSGNTGSGNTGPREYRARLIHLHQQERAPGSVRVRTGGDSPRTLRERG